MTYELIGTPQVQPEYSDEWETTMTLDLMREDGVFGREVWIVAGVPDYQRGSSKAGGTQHGYEKVRVFGDCPEHWCPGSFLAQPVPLPDIEDADVIAEIRDSAIAACEVEAIKIHRTRMSEISE